MLNTMLYNRLCSRVQIISTVIFPTSTFNLDLIACTIKLSTSFSVITRKRGSHEFMKLIFYFYSIGFPTSFLNEVQILKHYAKMDPQFRFL